MRINVVKLPTGADPDDVRRNDGDAVLLDLIESAPVWYKWLAGNVITGSGADAVKQVHDYLELIAPLRSEIDKQSACEVAADLSGHKLAAIKKELNQVQAGNRPERNKKKDGRARTSAANGGQGGRPRNPYADISDHYVRNRLLEGIFTRRYFRGAWRRYSQGRWHEITDDDMKADVTTFIRRHYRDLAETRTLNNIMMNMTGVDAAHVASTTELPVWLQPFDGTVKAHEPAPGWLPMTNGILNLADALDSFDGDCLIPGKDTFRPATPGLFSLHSMPYKFDPDAECPKFLKYLEDVQPDCYDRAVIRKMMGLLLVPETRFNVFFILHGEAGTGKSVLLHVIDALIGAANTCTVPLTKFEDDHFSWQLTENLLNSIDDMREANLKDVEGVIKIATDGNPLDIRRLYKDGGRAPVIARTVAACNLMPRFYEKSDAIWDRLRVITFCTKIRGTDKQNKNLKYEITDAELPGIFLWALKGLSDLREYHVFPEHSAGLDRKEKHRQECDPVSTYLQDYYLLDPSSRLSSAECYKHYRNWAQDSGYRVQSQGSFNRDVERVLGVAKKVTRIGGRPMQGFEGLGKNLEAWAVNSTNDHEPEYYLIEETSI